MEKQLPRKAQEVLSLLGEDVILKFRPTPRGYFRLMVKNPIPWQRFHRKTLLYAIQSLYRRGFVTIEEGLDGITAVAVTATGTQAAATLTRPSAVRSKEWDRKWRLILFDIPEEKKKFREAFRYHLRRMGFREFQRSAFLFPYPCAREVDALADTLELRGHITMVTAESISNEFTYKKLFGLL